MTGTKKLRGRPRKSDATLAKADKSTVTTTARVYELAELIVKQGYGRMAIKKYAEENYGIGDTQSERYWVAALKYLMPEDPEKYREALIGRNFNVLEGLLQKALSDSDTKTALEVVKTMNQLLGAGGKAIEIKDKDSGGEERKITISFSE